MDRPRSSRAPIDYATAASRRTASSSSVTTDTIRSIAGELPPNVEIVHASEVVGMDEHPAKALREKKDSTILVATDLVKQGRAEALVTAGHTGAGMAAAVLRLGRLPGVDRPALAVQMTTDAGPMVLLDIGANPDSTAENLAQYARMGAIFSERVLGVDRPRVALLSIGEEKGKGDARIQQATELLDQTTLNFVGNVEGKDVVHHLADVVVCDAVLGNVVIKFFEGLSGWIFDLFRGEFRGSFRGTDRVPAAAARDPADPRRLRLRAGRRLAAARRQGHRDHHPRPRPPADGHVRNRRRRDDGPDARPGSHRGGVRRRRGRDARRTRRSGQRRRDQPGVRLVSGPELTVGKNVMREMVRLAAFEVPGVLRVGQRRTGLALAARGPRRSPSRRPATASRFASRSSPGRATRWCR